MLRLRVGNGEIERTMIEIEIEIEIGRDLGFRLGKVRLRNKIGI